MGEDGRPSSKEKKRICSPLACLSYAGLQEIGWCLPTLVKTDLYSVYWFKCWSLLQIPSNTPRNNILSAIWKSLIPVKLTHKISHHNYVRPEDPLDNYGSWDVLEVTPFTKAISKAPRRTAQTSSRNSVMATLCRSWLTIGDTLIEPGLLIALGMTVVWKNKSLVAAFNYQNSVGCNWVANVGW